jgi:hypothetical protein
VLGNGAKSQGLVQEGELLRVISFSYFSLHYVLQNMEAWEEAKRDISLIPDHPNRLPEGKPDNTANNLKPVQPSVTARR